jgi:hypothetical protein
LPDIQRKPVHRFIIVHVEWMKLRRVEFNEWDFNNTLTICAVY